MTLNSKRRGIKKDKSIGLIPQSKLRATQIVTSKFQNFHRANRPLLICSQFRQFLRGKMKTHFQINRFLNPISTSDRIFSIGLVKMETYVNRRPHSAARLKKNRNCLIQVSFKSPRVKQPALTLCLIFGRTPSRASPSRFLEAARQSKQARLKNLFQAVILSNS